MTCPGLARQASATAGPVADVRAAGTSVVRTASQAAGHRLSGDAPRAQLARFAFVGLLATSVQALLFTALVPSGLPVAHLVSWGVSTAMANELHRRRTFHAGQQVGPLAAQVEGGGLAALGLLLTSTGLSALTLAVPAASTSVQLLLVLGVTAAVGLLRFVALRWSFLVRRPQPA